MSAYCNNCGASVTGAAFCASCGTSISNPTANTQNFAAPAAGASNSAALWAHLGGLLAYSFLGGVLGWVPPLIIRNDARTKGDAFGESEALEALNFHLQWLILNIAIAIVGVVTCGVGWILYLGSGLFILITGIMASVAASKGQAYRYPMMWFRLVK